MGRRPDHKALDVLNRIEDVIVNHYEEDCRHTARELRQILDAIVAILDADRVAGTDPALVGKVIQPDPEQQKVQSQPTITATIHSDDRVKSVEFPANRWFAAATDEEIRELASINWGCDLEADRIAYFMESLNLDVELVFDYCREQKRVSREPVGFEVFVDEGQAMAWLAVHRPTLWREFKRPNG